MFSSKNKLFHFWIKQTNLYVIFLIKRKNNFFNDVASTFFVFYQGGYYPLKVINYNHKIWKYDNNN